MTFQRYQWDNKQSMLPTVQCVLKITRCCSTQRWRRRQELTPLKINRVPNCIVVDSSVMVLWTCDSKPYTLIRKKNYCLFYFVSDTKITYITGDKRFSWPIVLVCTLNFVPICSVTLLLQSKNRCTLIIRVRGWANRV